MKYVLPGRYLQIALNDIKAAAEILTALAGMVRQPEKLTQMAEKGYARRVKRYEKLVFPADWMDPVFCQAT